ncbi:hypothetical protein PR048_032088 [Dryococelus australis]|uniref:Uncharacterized protein n=1 Tax=Dryococelus australis TaxID=614101 RepID=A0ABQ9G187_9NEOP|nr:hypothetical protein PR048_032088 [Dryococelus australis]
MGISFLTGHVFYLPFQQRREGNLHFTLIFFPPHGHLLPHWDVFYLLHSAKRREVVIYTLHSSSFLIPCMGISFLTGHVFYLPSNSGEK